MRALALILGLLALAGCADLSAPDGPTRAAQPESSFGPIKTFTRAYPQTPQRANSDMARDFLDLHFRLESGRESPRFTRFEEPLRMRVIGRTVPTLEPDLTRLTDRLRREAGITITRVGADEPANITVEVVRSDRIQRILPSAACFVVPNVDNLSDYAGSRRSRDVDWTRLTQRDKVALFVPADISPQELRDCLHEELAQALGPLNDLYRLPDSVFNDDNVHTVLTGFDMLMLRATYAPELRSGMDRETVARIIPGVLARLNPGGQSRVARPLPPTPRRWSREIEAALGPGRSYESRLSAAVAARRIAIEEGWQDHRRAFSEYTLGLMLQSYDATSAQANYAAALRAIAQTPGTAIYRALPTAQTAAFALALGRADRVLDQVDSQIPVAQRHENASLLATLMMLKSEALALQGRTEASRSVRLDSQGWARYGFGPDRAVQARLDDIAALAGYASGQAAARTQ